MHTLMYVYMDTQNNIFIHTPTAPVYRRRPCSSSKLYRSACTYMHTREYTTHIRTHTPILCIHINVCKLMYLNKFKPRQHIGVSLADRQSCTYLLPPAPENAFFDVKHMFFDFISVYLKFSTPSSQVILQKKLSSEPTFENFYLTFRVTPCQHFESRLYVYIYTYIYIHVHV